MSYRVGVDVGGTFTDLALYDTASGRLEFAKSPSTPADRTEGVTNGFRELLGRTGTAASEVTNFIHGTTVAINTLLERSGARTALITTAGFRDVLQIGRQDRPDLFDWRKRRSEPLVPRRRRFEAHERMLHTGAVLTPLDPGSAASAIDAVRASGAEVVAVCLLHSYANPAHELALGAALREALPDVRVVLSCEVLPEFKEYDRMSTTVINAYVGPRMGRYLGSLKRGISEAGVSSDLYVMQSNGGILSADSAARRPVQTILSGPAAGVIGCAALASQAGHRSVISMDMGGTSLDVALAYDGRVRHTWESEIEGFPTKVPMVDIHTLGAGGGSIAWVDAGGALQAGPYSAGADPGPACYGKGGTDPTVTDANLVLGRLGPSTLLAGHLPMDLDLASQAVADRIAGPLNLSLEEAAEGVIRVVNSSMVRGIRVVSTDRGFDPREFCLVAFGGAGPVHASQLAAEMGVPRVLVPRAPGVTSALGLLMADVRHDYVRTVLRVLDDLQPEDFGALFGDMEAEAAAQMEGDGIPAGEATLVRTADARYAGQGFELQVTVPAGRVSTAIRSDLAQGFHDAHLERYGYAAPDRQVEIVNLRVTALASLPKPETQPGELAHRQDPADARVSVRPVVFDNARLAASIYDRTLLRPGDVISGPAVVEQLDATTVVWPGQTAAVDAYHNLLLEFTSK